jgi:hypothetical protein
MPIACQEFVFEIREGNREVRKKKRLVIYKIYGRD